jgi:hypothetical protein
MLLETNLSKTWKKRQGFIALFLVAVSLWFFYDGAIHYPKLNVRYDRFKELEREGRDREWPEIAAQNGWPRKVPEKRHTDVDLAGQFTFGGICLAGGLAAAAWFFLSARQRLFADEESIHSIDGRVVRFDQITAIDRRKWESKGIAYAIYSDGGTSKRLTLDDYKFEGAEAIIARAEARLSPEKR